MLDLVLSTVSQGLLWAIMALGVFLTFRVLDIADLSVEGTFPLGAAVAATLIDAGHSVWFAMLIALIAGCIGGTVTALLTTKLKIPALLSGILTMIGLYSVNLMIMGKANVPLLRAETVFTLTEDLFGVSSVVATLIVGLIATTVVGVIHVLVLRHCAGYCYSCHRLQPSDGPCARHQHQRHGHSRTAYL